MSGPGVVPIGSSSGAVATPVALASGGWNEGTAALTAVGCGGPDPATDGCVPRRGYRAQPAVLLTPHSRRAGYSLVLLGVVLSVGVLAGSALGSERPPAQGASSAPRAQVQPVLPRTSDGQPDIQGYWSLRHAGTFALYSLEGKVDEEYQISRGDPIQAYRSAIVDPPDGRIPYQEWAARQAAEYFEHYRNPTKPEHYDTRARCYLPGVPRHSYDMNHQFIQTPGYVLMLIEFNHAYRIIPVDGRPHLGAGISLWQGDSRGRWEGQTLVVDSTNFNDKTWFDLVGSFHSDALHVVERWTVVDRDRIDYVATVEDPKVFTRPWTVAFTLARNRTSGHEIREFACREGRR